MGLHQTVNIKLHNVNGYERDTSQKLIIAVVIVTYRQTYTSAFTYTRLFALLWKPIN